jgi:hypothetical protein
MNLICSDFLTSSSRNPALEGLVICMITYLSITLNLFSIVCTGRISEWHNLLNLVWFVSIISSRCGLRGFKQWGTSQIKHPISTANTSSLEQAKQLMHRAPEKKYPEENEKTVEHITKHYQQKYMWSWGALGWTRTRHWDDLCVENWLMDCFRVGVWGPVLVLGLVMKVLWGRVSKSAAL